MALFDRLGARAARRAGEVADAALYRAEEALAEIPEIRLRREAGGLVIEAAGLARRKINDARLRFALWRAF